jgi:hypothetical protein
MKRVKASTFLGVHPSGYPRLPWSTQIVIPSGKVASFGSFRTEREAAEAYDRAVLYYRGPDARRNFPKKRLAPADEATLRAEAMRRAKLKTTSKYRGVMKHTGRWQATISVGNKGVFLGLWTTELKAAEAFDHAALFFGRDRSRLNFPDRRLDPVDPIELRRLAHASLKATTSSRYRGVRYAGYSRRPWVAAIGGIGIGPTKRLHLGTWEGEKDAARAYDRAALHYLGATAKLNFRGDKRAPADAQTLTREARREAKRWQTSRYLGVHWAKVAGQWRAVIVHEGRAIQLGSYTGERAAAEAYDDKATELRGARARLNFHPVTGKHVWGTRLGDLTETAPGPRRPDSRSP